MSGFFNRLPSATVVSLKAGLTQHFGGLPGTHAAGAARDDGLPLFLQGCRFGGQRSKGDVSALFAVAVAVLAGRANVNDDGTLSEQFIGGGAALADEFFQPGEHALASTVNDGHAGIFPSRDAGFKFNQVCETEILERLRRILRAIAASTIEQNERILVAGEFVFPTFKFGVWNQGCVFKMAVLFPLGSRTNVKEKTLWMVVDGLVEPFDVHTLPRG